MTIKAARTTVFSSMPKSIISPRDINMVKGMEVGPTILHGKESSIMVMRIPEVIAYTSL